MVTDEYEKLCKEYKDGKLTESQASSFLYKLKIMAKNPEEIKGEDIVDLNLSVNGSRLEMHLQEQSLKEAEHKKTVQKFKEQTKVMSRYERGEAKDLFKRELSSYKKKRNGAYRSALSDARGTVSIMIMLVVFSILLGTYVRIKGNSFLIALMSSLATLISGLLWFLARKESVGNAFQYYFARKTTRLCLKRNVIKELNKHLPRPSYQAILSGIKERNGSSSYGD